MPSHIQGCDKEKLKETQRPKPVKSRCQLVLDLYEKIRFSSPTRAKVRRQGPPVSARGPSPDFAIFIVTSLSYNYLMKHLIKCNLPGALTRSFPSCSMPVCRNKDTIKMNFYSQASKTNFHKKGFWTKRQFWNLRMAFSQVLFQIVSTQQCIKSKNLFLFFIKWHKNVTCNIW